LQIYDFLDRMEFANRHNVDLIVMGSRGLKGISRFVMGSVSRNVSERAKCTVMIITLLDMLVLFTYLLLYPSFPWL
jgi:hypothetical protein